MRTVKLASMKYKLMVLAICASSLTIVVMMALIFTNVERICR